MKKRMIHIGVRKLKQLIALIVGCTLIFPVPTFADQIFNYSDTLSRLKENERHVEHTIVAVLPNGLPSSGDTIEITYSADFTSVDLLDYQAVDFEVGDSGNSDCSTTNFTQTTLAADPGSAHIFATDFEVGVASNTITITEGTTFTIDPNTCIRISIGQNATYEYAGVTEIRNGSSDDDDTVTLVTSVGDSGVAAIDIVADDQVVVSATINPTMTMTLSSNSVTFGTFSAVSGRWATTSTGANASATTPTSAHTIAIGTNATSGYTLSYYGTNLTNGVSTIVAASISSDSDGTQGTKQYALSASASGSSTIASGYARTSAASWNFVPTTTTTLASYTAPISDTITLSYLANIASTTPAGSYSSTITYIATGNF